MITALNEISMTETNTSRRTTRRRMRSDLPCSFHHKSSTRPAKVQRVPEKKPGGTAATPAFIASQLAPQTAQSVANNSRCRVIGDNARRGCKLLRTLE
jgi:hypothetical protein